MPCPVKIIGCLGTHETISKKQKTAALTTMVFLFKENINSKFVDHNGLYIFFSIHLSMPETIDFVF